MKAFAISPGVPQSARVLEVPRPEPGPSQVLVRVLEVGICGTDSEINCGLYGEAPPGEEFLILGHEVLGALDNGDLVVPMVRRPCGRCRHCGSGSQDMCDSGTFTERGIKAVHGGLCEYIVEDPSMLIAVPPAMRAYAVLLEPMSVVAKGLRHAQLIQKRLEWGPRRALVVGAGPIGLLATLTLRMLGWEVVTAARRSGDSEKGRLVRSVGAAYHSVAEAPLSELVRGAGAFDFIFEASGSAQAAFDSIHVLAANGVLCLTSVTGGTAAQSVPIDRINCDLVLGNKLIFGTVNAGLVDFTEGLAYFERIEKAYPGKLQSLLTGRVSFENAQTMFEIQKSGIKTVFTID
ncbi:MAG: glucose 1-dehydrogenase [Elusimicrobia bacterium]|nr:glucose 1-dehydrogenase [Elusimicrobiota bacterium]